MTDLGSQGAPVVIATVARAGKFSFLISGTAERTACENRSIERLPTRVPGLKVLDIDRVICPRGHCIERLHGGWVRRDGLHFSDGPGGAEAAKRVLREAQRLSGVR